MLGMLKNLIVIMFGIKDSIKQSCSKDKEQPIEEESKEENEEEESNRNMMEEYKGRREGDFMRRPTTFW